MPTFRIDQIALYPILSEHALIFLQKLGLTDWTEDIVQAQGKVGGYDAANVAQLNFNYQAGNGSEGGKPLELEVLEYIDGKNWMDDAIDRGEVADTGAVSHLGMHVTEEELAEFHLIMQDHGVSIAQEVLTTAHTNPAIKDTRRYKYVIYDTRDLIGVDLKFIVRLPYQNKS